jgi:4'-phosphopantetheinyl transferase
VAGPSVPPPAPSRGDAAPARLAPGEIHLWQADLDAAPPDDASLPADERSRASRMLGKARGRFVRSRALLRSRLAEYGAGPPGELRIETDAAGKPRLASGAVRFSLAHAAGLWLAAFAADRDVGVDVERLDRDVDLDGIAARLFAPGEAAALRRLRGPARRIGFFRAWTVREAIVKLRGEGMFTLSARFEVEVDPSRGLAVRLPGAGAAAPWVAEVPVPDGFLAAVAADRPPRACGSYLL